MLDDAQLSCCYHILPSPAAAKLYSIEEQCLRGLCLLAKGEIHILYMHIYLHLYKQWYAVGLSMVLACTQPPTRLHVYGMNWTQKMWSGHNVHMEAMLIHKLEQQGRIKVMGFSRLLANLCLFHKVNASCPE